jgi:hypothetical protein
VFILVTKEDVPTHDAHRETPVFWAWARGNTAAKTCALHWPLLI